ncbi:MAG: FHA domain-containing protein [Deltaproteobacteria bacterium]|nr:FHA domain-containing protein [Deltaproteobacteria bacterium]
MAKPVSGWPESQTHEDPVPNGAFAANELHGEPTRIEQPGEFTSELGRLLVVSGNDRGKEFDLREGDNTIGRGLDNDIVLADIAVSRRHTVLSVEGGVCVVRDLGSGNGTVLNGQVVHAQRLATNDEIELGNTILRYVGSQPHLAPSQLADAHTVIHRGGTPMPSMAPLPAPVMAVGGPMPGAPLLPPGGLAAPLVPAGPFAAPLGPPALGMRPGKQSGLNQRSRKILMIGGGALIVLFAVGIAVKLQVKKGPTDAIASQGTTVPQQPDQAAALHFSAGIKAFRAKDWQEALDRYQKVLALAPEFSQARRYADRARAELEAQSQLEAAKAALAKQQFAAARTALFKIDKQSEYAADAQKLRLQIDAAQVESLLKQARELPATERDKALTLLAEAKKLAPENSGVVALAEQLDQPAAGHSSDDGRATTPKRRHRDGRSSRSSRSSRRSGHARRASGEERSSRTEPLYDDDIPLVPGSRSSRGTLKSALAHYAARQWDAANSAFSGLSGRRASKAAAVARSVGELVQRAQSLQVRNPSQAAKLYRQALAKDRSLPGSPLRSFLEGQLFKVARFQATSAMLRGDYESAYAGVVLAKRYGDADATLLRVERQLEKQAEQLFIKGYTLNKTSPSGARSIWQKVLRMVSPKSDVYKKTYGWLNRDAPAGVDADESN